LPYFTTAYLVYLDELPSLPKVKNLETFLAKRRNMGGCGVLSLQSISQLESIC